ncbi:hypothetical protein [Flavobacterium ginsenosidimutans]|uniref:Uncharacterized protein n=1 Tax=Flavobacterium ginsenosidimutans TaxID=687844 RepID=A0ABZ2Q7Q2_9FLAO
MLIEINILHKIRLFAILLFPTLCSNLFAQNYLYDQGGISLSYTTEVLKYTYCAKEKATVYLVKIRWTLSNNSGKNARIYYGLVKPSSMISWCTPPGEYDVVIHTNYQPSGTGFGGAVILKSGDKTFGDDSGWYFTSTVTPGWSISQIDFDTSQTNKAPSNQVLIEKNSSPKQPTYGISQQGDVINNPVSKIDYAQKQKEENKTSEDRMKAWQNSYIENQNQINAINNLHNNTKLQQQNEQQLQSQQKLAKQKQEHEKLNQVQKQLTEHQQRYEKTQIELDNAKNTSMNSYQQSLNNGKKDSEAMLDATLAAANQISDPTGQLAYTGVGLGLSLLMHLGEKKTEKLEDEAKIEEENKRIKLIKKAKEKFISDALNINKYEFSDLLSKERYAAILVIPKNLNADKQKAYFTVAIKVTQYSDNTYPLKDEIKNKISSSIDKTLIDGNEIHMLYPITNLDTFQDDFTKKMGSAHLVNLEVQLVNFNNNPFSKQNNESVNNRDFWGDPISKKNTINKKQTEKEKNFWDN